MSATVIPEGFRYGTILPNGVVLCCGGDWAYMGWAFMCYACHEGHEFRTDVETINEALRHQHKPGAVFDEEALYWQRETAAAYAEWRAAGGKEGPWEPAAFEWFFGVPWEDRAQLDFPPGGAQLN